MSEKLCLKWNDFQENVNAAFGSLREDNEFADVTLACEDVQQIEAHKVILAASSPFFQNLLKRKKHPHPLIYMREIKSENLQAIVDFLYCGEANVFQENLDSFLAIAEELQLKGLMDKTHNEEAEVERKPKLRKIPKAESSEPSQAQNVNQMSVTEYGTSVGTIALTSNFSGDFQELDNKLNSMMVKTSSS